MNKFGASFMSRGTEDRDTVCRVQSVGPTVQYRTGQAEVPKPVELWLKATKVNLNIRVIPDVLILQEKI